MRSIKVLTGSALALALFIIMAAVVYAAPGATDEIQGTIKDALGRPLSGASLILKSPDETVMGKTQSDADGHFVFSSVKPGTYAVLAEKPGFQAGTAIVTVEAGTIATTTLTLTAQEALEMSVVAERLNQARNSLSPKTGGRIYNFDQNDITTFPRGKTRPSTRYCSRRPAWPMTRSASCMCGVTTLIFSTASTALSCPRGLPVSARRSTPGLPVTGRPSDRRPAGPIRPTARRG